MGKPGQGPSIRVTIKSLLESIAQVINAGVGIFPLNTAEFKTLPQIRAHYSVILGTSDTENAASFSLNGGADTVITVKAGSNPVDIRIGATIDPNYGIAEVVKSTTVNPGETRRFRVRGPYTHIYVYYKNTNPGQSSTIRIALRSR